MNIPIFIQSLSILIWLVPPIRQYKTQYFTFFVILALFDPILYSIYLIFGIQSLRFYPIMTFLLIISLSNNKKQFLWIATSVVILILTYINQNDSARLYYLCIILFSVILYQIINKLMQIIIQQRLLNLFLSLLLFYTLINELKFLAMALNLYQGVISYYLATFTQIFFGIIFSFITITTKNYQLSSKLS